MPEVLPFQPRNTSLPNSVVRSADDQIASIERLAMQHFPDDEGARNAYIVELLKTRLREYAARFVVLEVR